MTIKIEFNPTIIEEYGSLRYVFSESVNKRIRLSDFEIVGKRQGGIYYLLYTMEKNNIKNKKYIVQRLLERIGTTIFYCRKY